MKEGDLAKLERNDMMIAWWMCNVTLKDKESSDELRDRLVLVSIRNYIQRGRQNMLKQPERIDKDSWVKKCKGFVVE